NRPTAAHGSRMICVIDNTYLARWRGLGANAVMVPEMEAFAKAYGFGFRCHAPKHSDRKAGEERSFLSQGALMSSVLDMVKWDAALNSEALLKKTSLEQMWTPVRLNDGTTYNYGFGWYLRPVPGHRTVAHGGGLPGFSTLIWRFIDDKLTVVVLSNCETADTRRIALGVAGFYVRRCCRLKSRSSFSVRGTQLPDGIDWQERFLSPRGSSTE